MTQLTKDERELIKYVLHAALDGRNGCVCSPAQPEKYAALMSLKERGLLEGGHSCEMTGPAARYFYVSAAGLDAVSE